MGLRDWVTRRSPASESTQPAPRPPAGPTVQPPGPISPPRTGRPAPAQAQKAPVDPRWVVPGRQPGDQVVWVPAGQVVQVGSVVVGGGAFYLGAEPSTSSYHRADPPLVNPALPVNFAAPDWAGTCLGYWPAYDQITPEGRAAYLSWLSWQRDTHGFPIGYVFLYFYGLERRSLIDAFGSNEARGEQVWILAELERLLALYGPANHSFAAYASSLISVLRCLVTKCDPENEGPPEIERNWEIPAELKVRIGQLVAAGRPLPAAWALAWVRAHPDFYLNTPAARCAAELLSLFSIRYREKYGDGMVVHPPKTPLVLHYRAASQGIGHTVDIAVEGIPDISTLTAPVKELAGLAHACTDELDSYSRFVGRHPDETDSLAALALLPSPLLHQHPANAKLRALVEWCEGVLAGNGEVVVETFGLAAHWPSSTPNRLNRSDAVSLAGLLETQGYGIEPDARFSGPLHTDKVVLFRLGQGQRGVSEEDREFLEKAGPVLQLAGVVIATTHGGHRGLDEPTSTLVSALSLSDSEVPRIHAHLRWATSLTSHPSISKRLFAHMDPPAAEKVGQFLIDLAASNGELGPAQVSVLTNAYRVLGLAPAEVYSLIHERSTRGASDLVTVRPEGPPSKGEPIPPRPATDPSPSPTPVAAAEARATTRRAPVVLDPDLVRLRLVNSAQAAALLGEVFTEDEPAVAPQAVGISSANTTLLQKLSSKPIWTRQEFDTLARSLGVLPNGALESLNDLAFDTCGESVIEGDDVLEINNDVLQELL